MGVIETLQTAGAVVLATPIAMLGVAFLADGRVLGAVFLVVAVLLVVLQRWLTTPSDLPTIALEKGAETVTKESDHDDN